MKVRVYQCSKCKQEVYSRAQHDYKSCGCKHLAVDGGGYTFTDKFWHPERIIGNISAKDRIIDLNVTPKELYDDWNYSHDKYGVVINGDRKEVH